MTEEYRKETHGGDSDNASDHSAELEMDDFVWEDVAGETGRYENYDVNASFMPQEWKSFSMSIRSYVKARRILSRVSLVTDSEATSLKFDS